MYQNDEEDSIDSEDNNDNFVRNIVQPKSFTFYDFGIDKDETKQSLDNILDSMSQTKQNYRQKKKADKELKKKEDFRNSIKASSSLIYGSSINFSMHSDNIDKKIIDDADFDETLKKKSTKSFDIKAYQTAKFNKSLRGSSTIANFHPSPPIWDPSLYPSAELLNSLYRRPDPDASGKVITSVGRDREKDEKEFQVGFGFPPPSFELCSTSYQKMLLRHLDQVIEKVSKEYEELPATNARLRNIKASCNADLYNLQQTKEKLLEQIKMSESKEIS
eukprot:gene4518-6383_t